MGEEPQERRSSKRATDRGSDGAATGSSALMVLILHLFTFLCCANWIFGPMGVVFAARSAMNRDRGRHARAELLARYSWYCLGAGLVMFVVMVVLLFALGMLGLPLAEQVVVPW